MNQRFNCINCGAPLDPAEKKCLYCGSFNAGPGDPVPRFYFLQNRRVRTRAIYPILIFFGIACLVYIYGIAFDHFSETTLIQITPLWFFPVVFGGFGYIAEKMLGIVAAGQAPSIAAAYKIWLREWGGRHPFSGLLLAWFLFPFSFFNSRNSLLIAFLGSVIWGVMLLVFFNGIFPSL